MITRSREALPRRVFESKPGRLRHHRLMGRPRRPDRVLTRNVGAAVPVDDADRMAEMCARVGTTQSEVIRAALYAFMAEHAADEGSQEVLPLRQAS